MSKTILITGATDGIGKQTALALARQGHEVWLHGRSESKCRAVLQDIQTATGNAPKGYWVADFSSLADVAQLGRDVAAQLPRLDVLINNAGVWMNDRVLTEDGFETTFQVNHLGPFLLTQYVLRLLTHSASTQTSARVVTVASQLHKRGQLHLDDLQLQQHFTGFNAYSQSKICNVLFAYALAGRVKSKHITSNALHPGIITTKLLWTGFQSTAAEVAEGAATSVYVAIAPELESVTGKYFEPVREMASADLTYDNAIQQQLWELSEQMVGRWLP